MAEKYLFFNSILEDGEYDREYQASDFAEYFGSLLADGLLSDGTNIPGLEVKIVSGSLNVDVAPGKAIIGGHLYANTTPLTLSHAIPEQTTDRIDRIVLRLDLRNQSRWIRLFVKEGESSNDPVPPELQRDNAIYELSLAQVRIRANTSTLDPMDVMDERFNREVCGLAHALYPTASEEMNAENVRVIDDNGNFRGESVEEALNQLATATTYHKITYENNNELGVWKKVTTKRANGSVLQESVMSNPDLYGNLQTRTITTYGINGVDVADVTVWEIEYDSYGNIVSEVIVV